MSLKETYIAIGLDKNGEADFSVPCSIVGLTFDQMKELRAMIPVAIGVMEDMWRRERERKNPGCQAMSGSMTRARECK